MSVAPNATEEPGAEPSADAEASATVAKGSFINLAGNVIGVIDPLFLILVTRALGADTLGSYILATTYVQIVLRLGVMGLDKGLLRHVPMAENEVNGAAALARVLRTGLRWTAIASIVATFGLLALSKLIVTWGGGDSVGDGHWWLTWFALALPGLAISQTLLFAMRGRNNMAAFVVVKNIVIPAMLFVIAVPAIFLGFERGALVAAYLGAAYGGALVSFVAFRRVFREVSLRDLLWGGGDRALVSFSYPQGITELLNYLLARIDIMMIAAFFPDKPELVAIYAIAAMLAGTVKKVRQAFDTSLAPVMSSLLARDNRARLAEVYHQVTRWVYLLFLLVAGVISFGAPLILPSFGAEYTAYWLIVPVLAAARWINAAAGPAQTALLMLGRSRLELLNNLGINLFNVALNFLMIPAFGAYGAACATATSLTLFSVVRAAQVSTLLDLKPRVGDLARITLAALLAAAIPCGVFIAWGTHLGASALATAIYIALFIPAVIVVGMHNELRDAWQQLRRPRAARRAALHVDA